MDDSTRARRIAVSPVDPGTVYTVGIRAVGNSTSASGGNPVSHIATWKTVEG
jgi:hypothetical protein